VEVNSLDWDGSKWVRNNTMSIPFSYPDSVIALPRQGEFTDVVGESDWRSITFGGITAGLKSFIVYKPQGSEGFYGNCALYLNWYVKLYDVVPGQYRTFDTPLTFTVYDASGKIVDSGNVEYSFYEVAELKGQQVTNGVACSIKFNVPEAIPAIRVEFDGEGYGKVGWFPNDKSFQYNPQAPIELYVPSATLIANVKSAELEALENISSEIIKQNNMTQESFTEVIGKVDEVYKELGTTNGLLEESMQQFEDWDTVTSVPGNVQDKTDKADQVIQDINSLVKPDPEDILPDIDTDTGDISAVLQPFFSNALILQLCTMVLGFAFVSYVLFGKKG